MRKIWRIFCLDVRHATKNIISLIVCVGLVVIPSLYAWFNIAGSWDPYGNTGNLKVAVANSDEGFQSDTIPVKINLGERVATDLSQKTTIGYVVTSEDDAIEGVRSGTYYAAIVIPEDFTKDMLTVFSDDIQQATIVYYSNQKENAIAPIVTDKAATSVKNSIQTDFAQSLGEIGAGALSEISGYVSDDQLMDISKNLSDAISQASGDLRTVSAHMGVYSSLLSSAGSIIDSSSTLLSGTDSSTQDVRNALAESAQGVRKVGDSVDTASAAIDEALSTSKESFDSVSDAVDTAFDTAQTDASDGAAKLRDIATRIDAHADAYQELDDSLTSLKELLPEGSKSLLDPTISRVEGVISTQRAMAERLRTSATNLENGVADAKQDHEDVKALIQQDAQEIEALARTVPDAMGVQLVPALAGLGAPFFDTGATALLRGMTRGVTRAHVARAALEGMAQRPADVIEAIRRDTGYPIGTVMADGGGSRNTLLMQLQADLANCELRCVSFSELSALGAAWMAGLATGVYRSFEDIPARRGEEVRYAPQMPEAERLAMREAWRRAIECARMG